MDAKGNSIRLKKVNNEIVEISEYEGLIFDFRGWNSCVLIEEGAVFANSKIIAGYECNVDICKTNPRGLRNMVIDMSGKGKNKNVNISRGCSCESMRLAMSNESNLSVSLGENCLISSNVTFRATDGHVIYDSSSKKILNRSRPIEIGDNVWIGASVTVLKGSSVKSNSIIGTCSLVAGNFTEENTVIAGNPAKIVKRGILWDRTYLANFDGADFFSHEQ